MLHAAVLVALVAASAPAKKITIDVYEADIVNVLRLLSDVSGDNFVVDDEVKGKVTLKLKNVPWNQALKVICQTKGLGVRKTGNIIRVAPQSQLDAEEMAALDLAAARELKGPLVTRIIVLNNARAVEMVPQVQALLTARGKVTADDRTNTLIVRDVASSPVHSAGF